MAYCFEYYFEGTAVDYGVSVVSQDCAMRASADGSGPAAYSRSGAVVGAAARDVDSVWANDCWHC